MYKQLEILALSVLILISIVIKAVSDENIKDQFPTSFLYSKPSEFIPNIWSAIGATGPPTYENTGHNNNLSFITSNEGVVVINAGASSSLAKVRGSRITRFCPISKFSPM